MKLLLATSVLLAAMALGSALYAYQRTADFGPDDAQTDARAEFYWSRLSYTPAEGSSFGGGYRGYGNFGGHGWGRSWSRDYPKADRQVSARAHEASYPYPGPLDGTGCRPRFR